MLLPFVLGLIACGVGAYFAFPQAVSQFLINLQRKAAGLTTKTVTVDNHNIVYLEGGQGDPLLLIHGFGADCDAWPRMATHLNSRFHLVIPDLPGFGASSRIPTARYGLDEQLARLAAFCKAVGLKKFHIAGNSMGGYLAAHYAARYPEQISSLWLLAPAGVAGADKSDLQAMLENGENPLLIRSVADFQRILRMCVAKPSYIPGAVVKTLAKRAIVDCDFHSKLFDELFASATPLEDALIGNPVPTLIQWGDKDRLLHYSGADILHRMLPNSRVFLMPDTGHVPMQEAPEASAKAYLDFQLNQ